MIMGKRTYFGKTWWGNEWVEAMERIDFDTNRLPRGKTYANTGKVKEIIIDKGNIFAKVQGTRPKPYKEEISLTKFSTTEKDKIFSIIKNNLSISAEMSLGKLPESILNTLKRDNIFLLPKNWKDILSNCSCPDWANPCKHLAAVYYIVANEIDKNPFLLFNLRGIETNEITSISGVSHGEIVTIEEKLNELIIPSNDLSFQDYTDINYHIDFSFENVQINSILSLLPDKPLFYPESDFTVILQKIYKTLIKDTDLLNINEDLPSLRSIDFFMKYNINAGDKSKLEEKKGKKKKNPKVSDENYDYLIEYFVISTKNEPFELQGQKSKVQIPIWNDKNKVYNFEEKSGALFNKSNIIKYFLERPFDLSLENNSVSSRFLTYLSSLVFAIIRTASFVPEVLYLKDNIFKIRYVPIIHSEKILNAVNNLSNLIPINFAFINDTSMLKSDVVREILIETLTSTIHYLINNSKLDVINDEITDLFLDDNIYKMTSFEEKHTAKSISDWLELLSFKKKEIVPVIRIESKDDDSFDLYIDIINKKDPLSKIINFSEIFKKKKIFSLPVEEVTSDIIKQLSIASNYMPILKKVIDSKGLTTPTILLDEIVDIITRVINIFNILGISIVIPKELKKMLVPQLVLGGKLKNSKDSISFLSLEKLLDFSYRIAIGNDIITAEDFIKLVKSAKGLVKYRDQYLLLKPEEVKALLDKLNSLPPEPSQINIIQSVLSGEMNGLPFNPDESLKKVFEDILKIEDISLPNGLQATLRDYQIKGFRWLYSNTIKHFGSCIADDMGLGKTIQVIALILKMKEEKKISKPALVICPTTLVGNWVKECQRFAPSINVNVYHGTERDLTIKNIDMIITTFGTLRNDIEKFKESNWSFLIVDEAQNIKNPTTAQTLAVKSVRAKCHIAMSGTPVENRLTELWSIFDFINKGYLNKLETFKKQFSIPIEKYKNVQRIEELKKITSLFLLRRLKSDKSIINDLPDKLINNEYCYLSKEQAAIYQQIVDTTMKEIETNEGINRLGLIFKLITSLKQICNHPVHYFKKGEIQKEASGKLEKAITILEKILFLHEKAIIFTQYKEMGEILVKSIKAELKEQPVFFHGGLSRTNRDKMVEDFQQNQNTKIMIVSLKAGGTGLNLTAATNVIHYDLWWNPAVEAQATDRTYRIGQTKNVMIYRLITIGTFEERIDEMIKAKQELAELTISTGEKWITELSNNELKSIFNLSRE